MCNILTISQYLNFNFQIYAELYVEVYELFDLRLTEL